MKWDIFISHASSLHNKRFSEFCAPAGIFRILSADAEIRDLRRPPSRGEFEVI